MTCFVGVKCFLLFEKRRQLVSSQVMCSRCALTLPQHWQLKSEFILGFVGFKSIELAVIVFTNMAKIDIMVTLRQYMKSKMVFLIPLVFEWCSFCTRFL